MKLKIFSKILRLFKKEETLSENEVYIENNTTENEEYERCVMCGAITCIPVSMHIDLRENYQIGFGQLCTECAKQLEKDTQQVSSACYEQLVLSVEKSKTKSKN